MKRIAILLALALAVPLLAASCADDDSTPPPNVSDAGPDVMPDAAVDSGIDRGPPPDLTADVFRPPADQGGDLATSLAPIKTMWSKTFGGPSYDTGLGVAVDPSGAVYLWGRFFGPSIDFGGAPLTSSSSDGAYLAKFSADGVHRWSKAVRFVISGDDDGDIAADPAGNVYVTGSFYSVANLGGGDLTSHGNRDFFLASYDTSGSHRWSKAFGSAGIDVARAVATDAKGNVYITSARRRRSRPRR